MANLFKTNKAGGAAPSGNVPITINNVGTTSDIDVAGYATASVTTQGLYKPTTVKDNTGSPYTTNGTKTITGLENYTGVKINVSVSGSLSETELWVNPNPASSMSSSVISLNGHQFNYYKYIKLVFRGGTSTTGQSIESEVIMSLSEWQDTADSSGHPFLTASCRVGSYRVIRSLWINNNSSFNVGTGYNTGTNNTDNGACIPYKMIGLS